MGRRPVSALPLFLALSLCSTIGWSQTTDSVYPSQTPVLKLKVILDKDTHTPSEKVFTKTVFTNLSDKALCFPKPDQGRMNALQGYLATEVIAPFAAVETERFIDVIDGRVAWPREKLLSEIKQRWIKLGPHEAYTTESAQIRANFNMLGQWQIKETYRPPEGSFHPTQYREYLKSAALSVGCTMPESEVSAEIVTVNITMPSDEK